MVDRAKEAILGSVPGRGGDRLPGCLGERELRWRGDEGSLAQGCHDMVGGIMKCSSCLPACMYSCM